MEDPSPRFRRINDPSPFRAGAPCTTPSLPSSPITHIPLPIHLHPRNPYPPSAPLAPLVI